MRHTEGFWKGKWQNVTCFCDDNSDDSVKNRLKRLESSDLEINLIDTATDKADDEYLNQDINRGNFRRERQRIFKNVLIIHVEPWLILINVWQKPLQYCKVTGLQLIKKNVLIRKLTEFSSWLNRGNRNKMFELKVTLVFLICEKKFSLAKIVNRKETPLKRN